MYCRTLVIIRPWQSCCYLESSIECCGCWSTSEFGRSDIELEILVILFIVEKTASTIGWRVLRYLEILRIDVVQEKFVQAINIENTAETHI